MYESLINFLKSHGVRKFKIISGNLQCNCPLHNETRPSFGVKVDRQGYGMYNCYGCESKGSIWDLVRELEPYRLNSEIKDYVDDFASDSPIMKLEEVGQTQLFKITEEEYSRFAVRHEYWSMRGIDDNSVKKFKLGYCPERWSVTFPVRAFDSYDLIGVCFRPVDIHPAFPLDLKAKVDAGVIPKYSYLRNTKPSYSLFGVEHVNQRQELYLFEGPIDAINFIQRNPDKQAVAKYGTMLTKAQMQYLQKFQKVYIVSDIDHHGRGQNNALTTANILREKGVLTTILMLESGAKDYTEAVTKGLNTNLVLAQ